jgi:hypothetical protein
MRCALKGGEKVTGLHDVEHGAGPQFNGGNTEPSARPYTAGEKRAHSTNGAAYSPRLTAGD